MKQSLKVRRLTLSIMGLFGANKPNVTRLNHKDEYYKSYYFAKNLCTGVELIAAIEHITKKGAAEMLMKAGISSYMGEKITKYIQDERAARELNQKVKITRFVLESAFAYTNTGTTDVNGNIIAPTITVAPPSAINFGTLKIGVNEANSGATGSVLVANNSANSGNWQVTAASTAYYAGYMYNGSNNLNDMMWIATVDGWKYANTGDSYTGTFDASGICTPSPFTLYAHQNVLSTDPAGSYGIQIVFTATITSYN